MNPANQGQLRIVIGQDVHFGLWYLDDDGTVTVEHPFFGTKVARLDGLPACRRAERLFRSMLEARLELT